MTNAIALNTRQLFRDPATYALLAIVALSAFLRFWNLTNTPLWFVDEGTNMNIAFNLANGRGQMFSITYMFVPHPPLFYFFSGLALKIFGFNITVARSLTSFFGTLTTALLFFIGKELLSKKAGLTASFLFAIFPLAIEYNRMNFDYNLVQLLATFTLLACLKYGKTRDGKWLYSASISVGAASITNPIGLGLIAGLLALFFIHKSVRTIIKSLLLALGVIALYPLAMLSLQWNNFLTDVNHYFFTHTTVDVASGSGLSFFSRGESILMISPWLALGIIGLIAYPVFLYRKKETVITAGLFAGLLLFTAEFFSAAEPRGVIQLFPFFAIGIAVGIWGVSLALIKSIKTRLTKKFKKPLLTAWTTVFIWLTIFMFIAVPVAQTLYYDFDSVVDTGFHMSSDKFSTQSATDAVNVAKFIDNHSNGTDFSVTSAMVTWLVHGNTTVLSLAAAMDYRKELRPTFTDSRFTFNCSVQNAKFMVTDNYYNSDSIYKQPVYQNILSNVTAYWTQVYIVGEYTVFLNPKYNSTWMGI